MTAAPTAPMPHMQTNSILFQLPREDFQWLLPQMQLLKLPKGRVIYESGDAISHYFFPVSCTLELALDLADGKVGSTSFISAIYPLHLIGKNTSHNRATVVNPGMCYRVPARVIHEALRRSPRMVWLLLVEAVKLFEQASLESVCLRHHNLEQVTAKLILLSMDKSGTPLITMTQQEMANSLGVRREGVTMAIRKFKMRQQITTHRGGPKVLDRSGLEHSACDCYKTLRLLVQAASERPE